MGAAAFAVVLFFIVLTVGPSRHRHNDSKRVEAPREIMKKKNLLAVMAMAYISLANSIEAHCAQEKKYAPVPDAIPSQPMTDKPAADIECPKI